MLTSLKRIKYKVRGVVQGVGFRPFVFNLANSLSIKGWVNNLSSGLSIEAEGSDKNLLLFGERLKFNAPAMSQIISIEQKELKYFGYKIFEIKKSYDDGGKTLVLPDSATCPDCLTEIFDSNDRHYLYPFTNCTNCGPRYSIIKNIPYDRKETSMASFEMCSECADEYGDPSDRRFHAQPNACPHCGPSLSFCDNKGAIIECEDPIKAVSEQLSKGKIVAVKGLGGFHFMVDPDSFQAVEQLRLRKNRPTKPFALIYPDMTSIENFCEISDLERSSLTSTAAPIVLLKIRGGKDSSALTKNCAPNNSYLGVMLPSNPLHHILLYYFKRPLIATSGNISDEPIAIDNNEAIERLGNIVDYFLLHDRDIVRPVDDSIVTIIAGRQQILRRARGFAPLPIIFNKKGRVDNSVIALGGHLKNNFAFNIEDKLFISQHLSDLENKISYESYKKNITDLIKFYDIIPDIVVGDNHPDYLTSQYGREKYNDCFTTVQHHRAHAYAVMAENKLNSSVSAVIWDGTGYGDDGSIWGGEFFRGEKSGLMRVGSLLPFSFPGGEKAIRDVRRIAVGLLYTIYGEKIFENMDIPLMKNITSLEKKVWLKQLSLSENSFKCSSMGRLFDGVSALMGLVSNSSYEGEAAISLEFILDENNHNDDEIYSYNFKKSANFFYVDWRTMIKSLLNDLTKNVSNSIISLRFHNTLVNIIVDFASWENRGVVLSGGCFQNRYLLENSIKRLKALDIPVYWPEHLPPNDGGISLGQLAGAMYYEKRKKICV